VGRLDAWWTKHRDMSRWRRDWPERIILVRHGESFGNTDKVFFSSTPDSQIELTDRGFAQASLAGLKLRRLVGNETVRFFHSPYMRTRQTLQALLKASFAGQTVQISSEPRLREQVSHASRPRTNELPMSPGFPEAQHLRRTGLWQLSGPCGDGCYLC
jgi:broad specificity phosphatase PhoE